MSIRLLQLLLVLQWQQVYSEEAEPVFKAESDGIELGYCFGVDYIVVYRYEAETGEEQLLANSSAGDMHITVPADLQHRTHISDQQQLLGLQISNLTYSDSAVYRWECWQNHTLVRQHIQQLLVCAEEVQPEKITLTEMEGLTELLCNSSSIGVEGTTLHWYNEVYPSYKLTLLLDSNEEVKELSHNRASLLLHNRMLKNNQQFYCAVIQGEKCLSFQNMHASYQSESKDLFVSQGDKVVLKCHSDGDGQHWKTPLGVVDGNNQSNDHMFTSSGDKAEDFSLIIPEVSDEYSGDYSCISSSFEVEYTVSFCSNKDSKERVVFEGGSISLECNVSDSESQRVQWSRIKPSGEYEVIHDSKEETVPLPEDLRGRLSLSKDSSSLIISHLQVQDGGIYSCAVIAGLRFLEDGDSYKDDYDEEDITEDDFTDNQYWGDSCILKKETALMLSKTTRTGVKQGTLEQVTRNPDGSTSVKPPVAYNGTVYAVVGALAGLLVISVIVAGIAVWRRRSKVPLNHKEAYSHSGPNTTRDIKMDVDPGCTERLTHNDEADA